MYVDGVYIGSPLAQLASFFDVQRVEVLAGPQGTLYGRNTTGGAINITTNKPTMTPQGDVSLEYGRFNSVNVAGGLSGPLVDGVLAGRLATQYVRDDGTTINRFDGDRVNNADRLGVRASLLYTPSGNDEAVLRFNWFQNRGGARQAKSRSLMPLTAAATGPDGLCNPGFYNSGQCADLAGFAETSSDPFSVNADTRGKDKIDLYSVALDYTHKFDTISLVSITAYQDVRRNDLENTDADPLELLSAVYKNEQREFSQELRLQSDAGPLKWLAGAYFMHDSLSSDSYYDQLRLFRPLFQTPTNPTGYNPDIGVGVFGYPYTQRTDSYAVFGQADYRLTDKLTLTVGARWSADEKELDYDATAEQNIVLFHIDMSKTFSDVSGRLGLRYDVNDSTNVYFTYNRGYLSGGFFGGNATSPTQLTPYQNETVDAYEIGSKSALFDRRLRLSLSSFYYRYQDIQAYSLIETGGLPVQVLDNAASAEIFGVEAEATAAPIRGLEISGGASYLHAKYGTYVSAGGDYTDNQMPQSPEFTLNTTVRYAYELPNGGQLVPMLDMSYRSKIYFDSTQTERLSDPAAFLLNAQFSWRSPDEHLEVGLWGKNLTGKEYLAAISPIAPLGMDLLSYAPPRTYGIFFRSRY